MSVLVASASAADRKRLAIAPAVIGESYSEAAVRMSVCLFAVLHVSGHHPADRGGGYSLDRSRSQRIFREVVPETKTLFVFVQLCNSALVLLASPMGHSLMAYPVPRNPVFNFALNGW